MFKKIWEKVVKKIEEKVVVPDLYENIGMKYHFDKKDENFQEN